MTHRRLPAAAAAALLLAAAATSALARGETKPPPPGKGPTAATGAVSGTVKDEAGAPIAGAEAIALHSGAKGTWKATSDAKGVYSIRGVPPGEALVLVRARTRVPVEQKVDVKAGAVASVDATLRLGVRFAGKVSDVRGAPVPGASVEPLSTSGWSGRGAIASAILGATKSGANGSFEVDGLEAGGRYNLRVRHPRFADVELPDLSAEAGSANEKLDVVLEDAAWLKGLVVGPDDKPIPGARVGLAGSSFVPNIPDWIRRLLADSGVSFGAAGPEGGGDKVDAQGRFEIGSLTEEDVVVSAIADGYFETKLPVDGLVPGQAKEVKVTLDPATAWIEGTVVDPDQKPIAGAKVAASGDHGAAGEATTDAQGRFRLSKVRSKTPVSLRASAKGRADARMTEVALNAGGVSITLQVAPRLKAKVLGPDGKPVPKLDITVWVRWEGGGEVNRSSIDQGPNGIDVPLPIGEVTVDVSGPDGLHARLDTVTAEAGEAVDAGTVTLERKARPGPVPVPVPDEPDDGGDEEGDE
jgi:protocatechuate 3,4-dioxygenase beta subunit